MTVDREDSLSEESSTQAILYSVSPLQLNLHFELRLSVELLVASTSRLNSVSITMFDMVTGIVPYTPQDRSTGLLMYAAIESSRFVPHNRAPRCGFAGPTL